MIKREHTINGTNGVWMSEEVTAPRRLSTVRRSLDSNGHPYTPTLITKSGFHLTLGWKAMLHYAFVGIKFLGGFEEFKASINSIIGKCNRATPAFVLLLWVENHEQSLRCCDRCSHPSVSSCKHKFLHPPWLPELTSSTPRSGRVGWALPTLRSG
ncbi:MAG: hypothetical protein DSM106950_23470 [Stigonema ocellatum SAG 48.90 = DSM 106950]|nr:hypothetical protein [Stigonema ocellatum SAG 48.90 = DSM 106950]